MARNQYSGDKRRREIAKKKKREEKLARKQHKGDTPEGESGAEEQDLSYLEYLYPGGVPEELLPKKDEADEESTDQEASEEGEEEA